MRVSITIAFLLLSSHFYLATAQSHDDIELLKLNSKTQQLEENYNFVKQSNSFVEIIFNQVFLFYKVFISSQDYSSCGFHPSCSVYAIESIQKQGGIIGVFDAFDRLTRCNGLSPEHYHINEELHLLDDKVRNIKYDDVK